MITPPRQTLFLSDLHLPADASPLREAFLRFLSGPGTRASAIYILGDLFESWIGDDIGLQIYPAEVAALTAVTVSGVPVFFIHGNRDFLIGKKFTSITGVQVLPDPSVEELDGRRVLISHGDQFCTDDIGYQRWRRFSRIAWMQALFLMLPRSWRMKTAIKVRGQSDQAKLGKADGIMDVNADSVEACLVRYQPERLIHGHTHRPAVHQLCVGDIRIERIVLPDWRDEDYKYLSMATDGSYAIVEVGNA